MAAAEVWAEAVMAFKIEKMVLDFHYVVEGGEFQSKLCYTPIGVDEAGKRQLLSVHNNSIEITEVSLNNNIRTKLSRLAEYIFDKLSEITEVDIDGQIVRVSRLILVSYEVGPDDRIRILYRIYPDNMVRNLEPSLVDLPEGAGRLIGNLVPTYEQLAWSDLRSRLGADTTQRPRKQVMISYRKTSDERVRFAEAVAHRLGREGFLPWFDGWEVLAGDSLPREIGNAFRDVYAVILILTADYPEGRWAREELETAITKRVEEGIRVIPVMYERCERPPLLRPLRYVDCTEHTEERFEAQFRAIIDALNEVELNPYR